MPVTIETITNAQILALRDAQELDSTESYALVGLCNEALVQLTKKSPLAHWYARAKARLAVVDAYNLWIEGALN